MAFLSADSDPGPSLEKITPESIQVKSKKMSQIFGFGLFSRRIFLFVNISLEFCFDYYMS
jgi:hypothetical protein